MKRLLKKITLGRIAGYFAFLVVFVAGVTFVEALTQGDLTRFPQAFLKGIGFLLVAPLILIVVVIPVMAVWYTVEGLTVKVQRLLESTQWQQHRPGWVKAIRFVTWTLATVLCLISGAFLLGRAQSHGDGWVNFVTGALAICLLFVGLQIFALRGFNPLVARLLAPLVERVSRLFRKK